MNVTTFYIAIKLRRFYKKTAQLFGYERAFFKYMLRRLCADLGSR